LSAGDAALATITRALNELASVPSRAAADACDGIEALIQKEFDDGAGPYGDPWKALAKSTVARGRSAPPLTDSGELRNVTVRPTAGSGISVELGEDYGAFHQVGTGNMPARPILPTGPLPTEWSEVIDQAATAAFDKTLSGSGGSR
jgi:phage gpG-like protein